MRAPAAVAALAVLLLAAPARPEVIGRLSNASEIRAFGGVAVASVRVRAPYRLARVHRDGRVVPLPGSTASGQRGEERVRTASTRDWDETEPAVGRGRRAGRG